MQPHQSRRTAREQIEQQLDEADQDYQRELEEMGAQIAREVLGGA